jgi:hypothetical protein
MSDETTTGNNDRPELAMLTRYRNLLRLQMGLFAAQTRYKPEPMRDPGITIYDQMMAEAFLADSAIVGAIEHWLTGWKWPALEPEPHFYLSLRLYIAAMAVALLQEGGDGAVASDAGLFQLKKIATKPIPTAWASLTFEPPAPHPSEWQSFFRWLLIDLWHSVGAAWIRFLSDSAVKRWSEKNSG